MHHIHFASINLIIYALPVIVSRQATPELLNVAALEGRQPKRIPPILDPKHTKQERIHSQNDAAPDEDGDLLRAGVGHAWDFEGKGDGGEGEDAVCT